LLVEEASSAVRALFVRGNLCLHVGRAKQLYRFKTLLWPLPGEVHVFQMECRVPICLLPLGDQASWFSGCPLIGQLIPQSVPKLTFVTEDLSREVVEQ